MNLVYIVLILVAEIILELTYLKIAAKYNITDRPNHRSSHLNATIRGGGIILPISIIIASFYFGDDFNGFFWGLILISAVSFIDDIYSVTNRIRFIIHLVSVALLFQYLHVYSLPIIFISAAFIIVIATINAVNFMDGINGITGGYGLITILTLIYINLYVIVFTQIYYLIVAGLALFVFNIFNFRIKARCFAGDVGSVSLAYILIFFILQLIIITNNLSYILFLLVYGLDVVSTMLFRLIRKENVVEAHRSHFYQFLANNTKWPHWVIATIYAVSQCIINLLITVFSLNSIISIITVIIISFVIFTSIRFVVEGKDSLLGHKAAA